MNESQSENSELVAVPRALLESLEFFRLLPTPNQVAEHVVLQVMYEWPAVAAVIGKMGAEGAMHVAGAFGLPAASVAKLECSVVDRNSPLCDAVRSNGAVVRHTVGEISQAYSPELNLGPHIKALVSLPLSLPQGHMGALTVFFKEDAGIDESIPDLELFGQGLALYLAMTNLDETEGSLVQYQGDGEGHLIRGGSNSHDSNSHSSSSHATTGHAFTMNDWNLMRPMVGTGLRQHVPADQLTARQLQILRLMADDMTNSQIAMRIGYSESTVRQETMAIYKFLGIHERHEAVRAALATGLIERAEDMSEH